MGDERATEAKITAAPPAEPLHRPRYALLVTSERATSQLFTVPDDGEVTIGRSDQCSIRVDDGLLSRVHAIVRREGEGFVILDRGSLNGTWVGADKLVPNMSRPLSLGDAIKLGKTNLVLQLAAGGARPRRLWAHGSFEARLEDDGRTPEPLVARAGQPQPAGDPGSGRVVMSGAFARLEPLVQKVAASNISVLVLGETGVGKEVLARMIHDRSPRAKSTLVCLNCASLSESLLESELFGHEKGAFTGAIAAKAGLLESASGGTAFLDEIGEMPLSLQAKLLRVLEQREVLRVGALTPRTIDVRFLAATNRDLEQEILRGRFRQDLYYRLNGFSLVIPPLRERVDEIEPLARHFLRIACEQAGRTTLDLQPEALAALVRYEWPGNIRELKNVIDRAVLLCSGRSITAEHLPSDKMGRVLAPWSPPVAPMRMGAHADSVSDVDITIANRAYDVTMPPPAIPVVPVDDERTRIVAALEKCAGNQTQAAKLLGISRQTLVTRLETYNLPRPRKR